MLKVFFVEDEIVVREGIKNNVSWEENGFQFCGEASDGELAYPLIQKLKPDIVITDIRMPFMDGLDLSRLIKKEMPWIKIIFLSGYGEFEYAKEAINIGITDYLLKPISGAELIKCMNSVKENILKEQEEKTNMDKYRREIREYEAEEKRRLFYDIVSNTQSLATILEKGKKLNMELSSVAYNLLLFVINLSSGSNQEQHLLADAQQELDALFDGKDDIIAFDCLLEGRAFLIKGSNLEQLTKTQEYYIDRMKQIMKQYRDISYFGGVGMPVQRLGELPKSYQEASRAFAYRYIWDINEILDYSGIAAQHLVTSQSEGFNMSNMVQMDKKKVVAFLKSGSKEEIDIFVEEYLKCIGNENKSSMIFRQYLVMDVYYTIVGFLEELGYGAEIVDKHLNGILQDNTLFFSYDVTIKYVEKLFNLAIDLRDEVATKSYNDMLNRAKAFINENYTSEDISLNQVASKVFISPNHFSAVFSQKTGQTFVKYLTDLRMNRAKELLRCTDMRSQDIGFAVGFRDPHYFSYLFKKTQDCTPKQYRYKSLLKEE